MCTPTHLTTNFHTAHSSLPSKCVQLGIYYYYNVLLNIEKCCELTVGFGKVSWKRDTPLLLRQIHNQSQQTSDWGL